MNRIRTTKQWLESRIDWTKMMSTSSRISRMDICAKCLGEVCKTLGEVQVVNVALLLRVRDQFVFYFSSSYKQYSICLWCLIIG
jgi:hypothetical protein